MLQSRLGLPRNFYDTWRAYLRMNGQQVPGPIFLHHLAYFFYRLLLRSAVAPGHKLLCGRALHAQDYINLVGRGLLMIPAKGSGLFRGIEALGERILIRVVFEPIEKYFLRRNIRITEKAFGRVNHSV